MSAPPTASVRAGNVSNGLFRRLRSRLVPRWWRLLVLLGLVAGVGVAARPHLRAWYHRRIARGEMQRYRTIQAVHHLLICRGIWPRDPETLLLAARAARRAQVYSDAERLLHIYREVRGRDEAYAFEQLLLAAECRVDEVSEQCGRYVQEGRFDAALLQEALTRGYLRQYRLGQARFTLDHWKQMQPDNPQIYFLEGTFLLDYLHVSDDAVVSYRRSVELDADHEEARLGLALALKDCKEFAAAVEQFGRLLQRRPDDARLQVSLAECRDGLGESVEAARLVDDVLARLPQFPPALSLRGQLALKGGQWAEAERWLRPALLGNPMDRRARYDLIRCLEQTGKDEEAQRHRREFQQQEDDVVRFHEIVTKKIAERPTDPSLHFALGQILLRSGQREEAVRLLRNALQIDPNFAPARKALADCLNQVKVEAQPSSP
jgi:predicted Zn-dependent protease